MRFTLRIEAGRAEPIENKYHHSRTHAQRFTLFVMLARSIVHPPTHPLSHCQFHIEQAKMRSKLRIEAGRAKPIDVLVKYITTDVESPDVDIDEPFAVFNVWGAA